MGTKINLGEHSASGTPGTKMAQGPVFSFFTQSKGWICKIEFTAFLLAYRAFLQGRVIAGDMAPCP